jgi:hypothetical protein
MNTITFLQENVMTHFQRADHNFGKSIKLGRLDKTKEPYENREDMTIGNKLVAIKTVTSVCLYIKHTYNKWQCHFQQRIPYRAECKGL